MAIELSFSEYRAVMRGERVGQLIKYLLEIGFDLYMIAHHVNHNSLRNILPASLSIILIPVSLSFWLLLVDHISRI